MIQLFRKLLRTSLPGSSKSRPQVHEAPFLEVNPDVSREAFDHVSNITQQLTIHVAVSPASNDADKPEPTNASPSQTRSETG